MFYEQMRRRKRTRTLKSVDDSDGIGGCEYGGGDGGCGEHGHGF